VDLSQIPALLKQISYADPRVMPGEPEEVAAMAGLWAVVLKDVPVDFAMNAVGEHYAKSPYPIKPSDIAERWNTVVRDRMRRHTGTFEPNAHPGLDPDDIAGYHRALRAEQRAVVTGRAQPTPLRAITSADVQEDDVRAMRQQQDLRRFITDTMAASRVENERRRRMVLRYPDLAQRLTEKPLQWSAPEKWTGFVEPETWGGRPNRSPGRKVLLELIEEAERRAGGEYRPAA
jgi:hypothetical protein